MWAGILEEMVEESGGEEEKEMVREVAMEAVVVAVVRKVRELEGLAQVEVVLAEVAGWVVVSKVMGDWEEVEVEVTVAAGGVVVEL